MMKSKRNIRCVILTINTLLFLSLFILWDIPYKIILCGQAICLVIIWFLCFELINYKEYNHERQEE